jgi:integrin beta 8
VNVIVSSGGTSGPRGNGWLSGTGAPSNSVGFDGDFYLDVTATNVYYGPKTAGAWGSSHAFTGPRGNFGATTDPTVNSDSSAGYGVGSLWVNTSTGRVWLATNVTVGAATWVEPVNVGNTAGGDLGGAYPNPTVTSTHLTAPLPVAQGGTGSATQNFVDLTTNQTIAGNKNFTYYTTMQAGQVNGAFNLVGTVGFFGATAAGRQTVTGAKGGNAALASLISALAALGLITDNTT